MGMKMSKLREEKSPPRIETVAEAAMAVLALPFFAIGKPSMRVTALGVSPGILKRIAMREPPNFEVAWMEIRSTNAGKISISQVRGIMRAMACTAPIPGKMPTTTPMVVPRNINRQFCH